MTGVLKLIPIWLWWCFAMVLLVGLQQWRVVGARDDRDTAIRVLEIRTTERDSCRSTRVTLELQAAEQNRAMAELLEADRQKRERAQRALVDAQRQARSDYRAANRLQQERIGGNSCAAAESVIDQELGL
jgi:hypothetical protein